MSRLYVYMFTAIVVFGSLGTAFLKQVGVLNFSFFISTPPSSELYYLAVLYCVTYAVGLLLFRRFLGLYREVELIGTARITLPPKIVSALVFGSCAYALFYVWLEADLLTERLTFRHSGNEIFMRISLVIFLAGIFAVSIRPTFGRVLPLALLLFAATLYPAAGAGRMVAIPFLIAAATMTYNGYRVLGAGFGLASVVALSAAFSARAFPSFEYFWSTFSQTLFSFDPVRVVRPSLQNSFPGLDTMNVVLGKSDRIFGASFQDLIDFTLYYSPAPSFLFPDRFFSHSSLNGLLGINRYAVGINTDLYSESILWFGYSGVILVPFLLAAMTCGSFAASRTIFKVSSYKSQLVGAIPVIWMLVGGMVFSLRAGSRFVWAIIIVALLLKALRALSGGSGDGRLIAAPEQTK
ncbi:hypothetical protein [Stakelama saccharophila]|uniref:Oligosaccharide repeat unit polymerase n=1 Tax=Stakelama saccharophila TaxID=3075605 RepID=A0ABZ0BA94_9SPHN|nr:hypothetical protein [Stakelama sp. W311]WNO53783.1 hypothetical protein RPR59_00520 [Stakelama sp. W311]